MAYYLMPPDGKPASIAPSCARIKRGVGTSNSSTNGTNGAQKAPYPYHTESEQGNPTVIPEQALKNFHFTFLIRHPRSSVPSYYRCTVPPLDEVTGFYEFMPSEAGYAELRRIFDYLRSIGHVGPHISGRESKTTATNGHTADNEGLANGHPDNIDVCVVDADDLLDDPSGIIEAYCKSVGLEYDSKMLDWSTEEDHRQAKDAFKKWKGFHDDAINSSGLKPRLNVCLSLNLPSDDADRSGWKKKKVKSVHDEDDEWVERFGEKGAKVIRETVNANIEDYEYLKQFALKPFEQQD
ncbi:MAG: hypothetical protein Q9195_003254 [Heterodermia aff. obscurata]